MAEQGQTQPTGKSLDEIAAMLAENTRKRMGLPDQQAQAQPQPQPNEVTEDDTTGESEAQAADEHTGNGGDEQVDAAADAVGDDGGDSASASADDDQGAPEAAASDDEASDDDAALAQAENEFEIDDDTLFEIDDEGTEVSYADLKAVYQADKEQLALVAKQREATQEALTERARAHEDSQKARAAAQAVFQYFEQIVATPMVQPPNEALKTTHPDQYIAQLEAYQADQQRIHQQRGDLTTVFNQHNAAEQELLNNRKAQEIKRLAEEVPALSNPETKQEASKDILDAAEHFGFSPEEVNAAIDHRIYKMAYYAQQYLKIMNGSKIQTGEMTEKEKKTVVRNQTRTLRSRGTTAKNRQTAKANRVKAAKIKATKSGKVNDVADFIAARTST